MDIADDFVETVVVDVDIDDELALLNHFLLNMKVTVAAVVVDSISSLELNLQLKLWILMKKRATSMVKRMAAEVMAICICYLTINHQHLSRNHHRTARGYPTGSGICK